MVEAVIKGIAKVERVDGAQARLKHLDTAKAAARALGGKGGWGSGEIETSMMMRISVSWLGRGKGGWGSGEIETRNFFEGRAEYPTVERVDGAQARLKHQI